MRRVLFYSHTYSIQGVNCFTSSSNCKHKNCSQKSSHLAESVSFNSWTIAVCRGDNQDHASTFDVLYWVRNITKNIDEVSFVVPSWLQLSFSTILPCSYTSLPSYPCRLILLHLFIEIISPRLLQRVRLDHLRCNLQNMTSLVCHCTKCAHTQYVSVRYDWLYILLFCLLIQYQKLFWKVLKNFAKYPEILPKCFKNNLKIFRRKIGKFLNYCGEFEEYFLKFWELYRKSFKKISGKILEDFEKYFGNFREVFQKTL